MGSGKSSVGRLLAQQLGWPRHDVDEMVAAELGMPIPRIFAQLGEARFRDCETEALARFQSVTPAVMVTGGGIVLRPENVRRLQQVGTVVWLTATLPVLVERLARRSDRPLLQTADPRATIAQLLADRQKFYENAAQVTIDTSELDHLQVAEAIKDELQLGK